MIVVVGVRWSRLSLVAFCWCCLLLYVNDGCLRCFLFVVVCFVVC